MSEPTRQTLLTILAILVCSWRYYSTRPEAIINPIPVNTTVVIEEIPYSKHGKQYIKIKNRITIITKSLPRYSYGDVIEIHGTINQNRFILNPELKKISVNPNKFIQYLYNFRERLENALNKHLPKDNAALATGMLLGTNAELSSAIETNLRRTGTIHMLVVSGFNLTILTTTVMKLAGRLHRRVAIIFAALASIVFIILSGAQPPVLRAGAMAGVLFIAQYTGRPVKAVRVLLIAICLCVFLWPDLVQSVSFQLSCAATGGILVMSDPIKKILSHFMNLCKIPANHTFTSFITTELSVSLSAQLSVTPLIMNIFGTLSLVSPVANIFISWLIPYIMISALIVCLADLISEMIAKLFAFVLYGFTAYFLQIIEWFAHIPYAALDEIKINVVITIALYLFLLVWITKTKREKNCSNSEVYKKEGNE